MRRRQNTRCSFANFVRFPFDPDRELPGPLISNPFHPNPPLSSWKSHYVWASVKAVCNWKIIPLNQPASLWIFYELHQRLISELAEKFPSLHEKHLHQIHLNIIHQLHVAILLCSAVFETFARSFVFFSVWCWSLLLKNGNISFFLWRRWFGEIVKQMKRAHQTERKKKKCDPPSSVPLSLDPPNSTPHAHIDFFIRLTHFLCRKLFFSYH